MQQQSNGDVPACNSKVTAGTCRKAALTPRRSFLSRRFCCIKLFRSGLSYQRNFFALSTGRRRYCCCSLPACDSGEVPAASPGRPSAGTCKFCLSLKYTHHVLHCCHMVGLWCVFFTKCLVPGSVATGLNIAPGSSIGQPCYSAADGFFPGCV